MMKHPIYLVPFDFSEATLSAMEYCFELAEYNKGLVVLLHVVKRKIEKKAALEKLQKIESDYEHRKDLMLTTRVLVGELYDDITKASEVLGASLVVMGTHGAKGMQRIIGSHALKMVTNTSVPFIIMQNGKPKKMIDNIVLPFNYEKESIQVVKFAGHIAKQFNSKIHMVGYYDDQWTYDRMRRQELMMREQLSSDGVDCELVNLPRVDSYEDELRHYAHDVDADLIAVTYFNDSIFSATNTFVQKLLENDLYIPVLTVNAEDLILDLELSV
ncbi:MAG: universal stress protein [Crocinitomicaceae bacterium]|nr:universal stress protein [Crocinitomicaceae bacterium]